MIKTKNKIKNKSKAAKQPKANKSPRADFDSPWKEVLNLYFKDFMLLCCPNIYKQINWEKGYKFLDKELNKICRGAVIGNREVDKLVEVNFINGQIGLVFFHIEIQAKKDVDFGKRLFIYRYRLIDLYGFNVLSIGILIDDDPTWKPDRYFYEFCDTVMGSEFIIIKILDFKSRSQELTVSKNRFAKIILAQLAVIEKCNDNEQLDKKLCLTEQLYSHGFSKEDVLNLYRLIDWLIVLPENLEIKYHEAINKIEEKKTMTYVTTAERIGIKIGIKKGIELEQANRQKYVNQYVNQIAANMFAAGLDKDTIAKIMNLSAEELEKIKLRLFTKPERP